MRPFTLGQYSYQIITDPKPREEANTHCHSLGGELLSIESIKEHNHVRDRLRLSKSPKDVGYWMSYRWSLNKYTPSTHNPLNLFDWWRDTHGNGRCLSFTNDDPHQYMEWGKSQCHYPKNYICKILGKSEKSFEFSVYIMIPHYLSRAQAKTLYTME